MTGKAVAAEAEMEPVPGSTERRRNTRKRVLLGAVLDTGGRSFECVVVNLSLGGARIHSSEPFLPGQKVTLELQRFGSFEATVIWQRERSCGLRFTADAASILDRIGGSLPLTTPDAESAD